MIGVAAGGRLSLVLAVKVEIDDGECDTGVHDVTFAFGVGALYARH
ncbi:hypothetical protein AB0F17_35520 [Nonomuraea sp. NPDC026600]